MRMASPAKVEPFTKISAMFPAAEKTAVNTRRTIIIFFAYSIVGGYFILGWHPGDPFFSKPPSKVA
jgi:hypothetical protein